MPDQKPDAFMSYTRIDDQALGGRITKLCVKLGLAIRMHTGQPFEIFQDVKDIGWGEAGEERIKTTLDEVKFLIPILTPSFFNSEACLDEVRQFLKHEKQLGRVDLVLPVYWVDHPPFNDKETRKRDELAKAIAAHQWCDWRDLRHVSLTSAAVGRMLQRMAEDIRDSLKRLAASDGPAVSQPSVSPDTGATSRGRSSQPPAISP